MQVSVVEQPGEEASLDQALFVQWMDERLKLQLNLSTKLLLLPVLEEQAKEAEKAGLAEGRVSGEEFFATCLADGRAWTALCQAVHQAKRGKEASPENKDTEEPAKASAAPDASHLLATDVETWFGLNKVPFQGLSKLLDVVRDEWGVAQEVRALFQRHKKLQNLPKFPRFFSDCKICSRFFDWEVKITTRKPANLVDFFQKITAAHHPEAACSVVSFEHQKIT